MGILKYKLGKREILVINNVKNTINYIVGVKTFSKVFVWAMGMATMLNSFGQGNFLARDW